MRRLDHDLQRRRLALAAERKEQRDSVTTPHRDHCTLAPMDENVRARLQAFITRGGFDQSLVGLEVIDAEGGRAKLRIVVELPVQNLNGTLHGGAIATLVDDAGTLAIMTADKDGRPGVTTDLNVSYLSAGRAGEAVLVEATVLKSGRTLAYVNVDLRRERDGALIAQGRMTKFLAS
jgi:acyl-coenzyme A thioesterase 13